MSATAADFEQRIQAQIHRSLTIAHAANLVTGLIDVAGTAELRRRPRAWAALAVSAVQGTLARRAMLRGGFASRRVAGAHALCAALNQELMPELAHGISKRERCWVRYQAMWLSAMGRAGGSTEPGLWTALAHVPVAARAVGGEQEAIAHACGHTLWMAFLQSALNDTLLRGPEVLDAIDRRAEAAGAVAAEQATRDALSTAVLPLVERMRTLRANASVLSTEARTAQCRTILSEADDVCDRAAQTTGDDLRDRDLFETMLAQLQRRSDRTTTISYAAIMVDCLFSLAIDLRRRESSRLRVLASAAITIGQTVPSLVNPPPFMTGALEPASLAASTIHGLAAGSAALVLHGAPAGTASFENYDRLTYTSGGLGSDQRSVWLPWAIGAAIGLPTLARMQRPGERMLMVGHVLGISIGIPLALNSFFRGLGIANEAAAASRQLLVAEARAQAVNRATLWAQLAAHDYVKQTARFLVNHPDTPLHQVEEVLSDAIHQLEDGLASSFQLAPRRSDVSELVAEVAGAYRRLALEPALVLDLSGTVSAEVERAILTAVNQGLANVLAHTGDAAPVVWVRTSEGGAVIDISNANAPTGTPVSTSAGTGFRLLDDALAPVGGIRTLRTDEQRTVLRVRIPSQGPGRLRSEEPCRHTH